MRHDEGKRPDDVRRGAQQHFALLQRLAHQAELVILEVAQSAVDELGAGGRGVGREIVLLAKQDGQTATRRIARDAGAVDATADDEQIVNGAVFGQAVLLKGSQWVPGDTGLRP